MIPVAFRFDDFSPFSNQPLERRIIEALAAHNCRATVGVIPFGRKDGQLVGLTKDRADHLLDAVTRGTVEIALHGFSHQRRGTVPHDKPTEFSGLAFAEQLELITRGLQRLKEIFGERISGFIPPWNSFDAATLDALERLPFRYLSGAWEVPLAHRNGVALLPRTCNLATLKAAVSEARKVRALSPMIIVAMHHYDFLENGDNEAYIDVPAFDKLLRWLIEQTDLTMSLLGEIAALVTAKEWRRGLEYYRHRQSLYWRWRPYVPQYVFVTRPLWRLVVPWGRNVHLFGNRP